MSEKDVKDNETEALNNAAAENAESNSKNFLSAFQKCFAPYSALCCSCCSSNVSPVLEFSSTIVSIFCLFIFFIVLLL